MGNLNEKIQTVAADFARSVLGMIRGMTLNELVSLTGLGGDATKTTRKARKAAPAKAAPKVPAGEPKAAPKRKITNSPALAAARKIQGQYLGLLRKFSGMGRKRLKNIAKSGGVPAAVAEMKKLLGRS